MRKPIRVLTVRQPYADNIISGQQWCENRTWRTTYRGELFIHASKFVEPGTASGSWITGAILGKVLLVDVIDTRGISRRKRLHVIKAVAAEHGIAIMKSSLEFVTGPYCWIVTHPVSLGEPIHAKGQLGVWRTERPILFVPKDKAAECLPHSTASNQD